MQSKSICLFLCTATVLITLISCKKNPPIQADPISDFQPSTIIQPETHRWFYFTRDGFDQTLQPSNSPDYPMRPWTQAPRISGTITDTEKGYLLVNRRGLIQLSSDSDPVLIPDARLFSGTTADSLFLYDGDPVFKLYINTLFEEKVDLSTTAKGNIPVLVQYNSLTNLYYPLINKADLKLSENAQVTAVTTDTENWYFSAKESDESQTTFTYLSLPIQSVYSSNQVNVVSEETFRTNLSQKAFTEASGRYKELLSVIPKEISFTLHATDFSQSSQVYTSELYYSGVDYAAEDQQILDAYGQTGKTWTLVLFSDGTCYFAGSLPKLHIVNNGKPVYFRLPALPAGMEYTGFALCGSKLYCGWEEINFYNTGKAGFLEVDLEQVLY